MSDQPHDLIAEDSLLTATQIALDLKVSARYIRDLASRGQIPCRCIRGMYRFDRAEVREWLDKFYRGPESGKLTKRIPAATDPIQKAAADAAAIAKGMGMGDQS